jgi:hypothetical protein
LQTGAYTIASWERSLVVAPGQISIQEARDAVQQQIDTACPA